jgi:mono/diheme cytochrome c family protein
MEIRYYSNGDVMYSGEWNAGHYYGRHYGNYQNGRLAFEQFYSEGYKAGTWKAWNENGVLLTEIVYEDKTTGEMFDVESNTTTRFLEGKPVVALTYTKGELTGTRVLDEAGYQQLRKMDAPTGKSLFIGNCSMCHHPVNDIVGPPLKGVDKRRKKEWLVKMIRDGEALRLSGDKTAEQLFITWHKTQHPDFNQLTDEELNMLLDYIKKM